MTPRYLRALGLRTLNNLDAKQLPVEVIWGDRDLQIDKPFPTPLDDPGVGSSASESITVIQSLSSPPSLSYTNWGSLDFVDRSAIPAGTWRYAIACLRSSSTPPGTWYVPSGLTGNELWYPHGQHAQGRWMYSEFYGPCLNYTTVLMPGGTREIGIAAYSNYRPRNQLTPAWRNVFKVNSNTPFQTGTADEIICWDDNRRTDLVRNGLDIWTLNETVDPPSLGTKVATIPSSFWATYFWDNFGNAWTTHRIFVASTNEIWTFQGAPDLNPGTPAGVWFVKCDGSNQVGTIAVPAAMQTYWKPDNFTMTYDRDNDRVVVAQSRFVRSIGEYTLSTAPVDIWEVNPATRIFSKRTDVPDINARVIASEYTGRTALMHMGYSRFMLSSPTADFDRTTVLNSNNFRHISTENTRFFELQLPPAVLPRQIKFTRWTAHQADGSPWASHNWYGKHSRWAYRATDGRVYQHGGDFFAGGGIDDSYRQDMYSVIPEQPTTWRQEQLYCLPTAQGWQPKRPDECGFVWDAGRDLFWCTRGMIGSDTQTWCGGTNDPRFFAKVATWDPKVSTNRWTEVVLTYNTALQMWPTFEHSRHANRDESVDHLCRIGSFAGTLGLNVVYCASSQVGSQYLRFLRNAGSLPSYVSIDFSNLGTVMESEYTALDPATGYLYFFNWMTGDLFYVDTRAAPTIGSDGFEDGHLYWILRANAQCETENEGFLIWCNGKLILMTRMVRGRPRVYSWASGEARLTEHSAPYDFRCTQLTTYTVGAVQKAYGIGVADTPVPSIANECYFTLEFA